MSTAIACYFCTMMKQIPVTNAAAVLGSLGGRAGKGKVKKRSAAHYKRISMLGVLARQKKSENKY